MKVAELFTSIQGEGVWTGTLMNFIRLAGCPVGEYPSKQAVHSICTAWHGGKFTCDTNYRASADYSIEQLVTASQLPRVVLTGGEPLAHPGVADLVAELVLAGKTVHIETSGTIDIFRVLGEWRMSDRLWITCSPKYPFLGVNRACIDEYKLVVAEGFDPAAAFIEFGATGKPMFLQPVNYVDAIDLESVDRCLKILETYPDWRLSVQMHKALNLP